MYSPGKHDMKTDREKNCKAGNALTLNILRSQSIQGIKAKSVFGKSKYSDPEYCGCFGALAIPAWVTWYAAESRKKKKGSFYHAFQINLQLLVNIHLLVNDIRTSHCSENFTDLLSTSESLSTVNRASTTLVSTSLPTVEI